MHFGSQATMYEVELASIQTKKTAKIAPAPKKTHFTPVQEEKSQREDTLRDSRQSLRDQAPQKTVTALFESELQSIRSNMSVQPQRARPKTQGKPQRDDDSIIDESYEGENEEEQ